MQAIKESDIEILISTQNRDSLSFLKNIFPCHQLTKLNILIINQTSENCLLKSDYKNIRVINSFEKGLSKSRNLALKNASKKIGVIADDDILFKKNFQDIVIQGFIKFPKSAMIRFMYEKAAEKLTNSYPKKEKNSMNWFDILNTVSVEMVINTQLIKQNNLKFDEKFGLNSTFGMGEEAVFLSDCKTKKLLLSFYPAVICQHLTVSSHQKILIAEIYKIQGAVMSRIFKKRAWIWVFIKLFFDLKHKNIQFYQVFSLLKQSNKGIIAFKKLQK